MADIINSRLNSLDCIANMRRRSVLLLLLCISINSCVGVGGWDTNTIPFGHHANGVLERMPPVYNNANSNTEFTQTRITDKVYMEKRFSPYIVRDDIFIHETGNLIVEAGVTVKFAPMVGITVKGILTAVGYNDDNIVFTALEEHDVAEEERDYGLRLMDGPDIISGRLQIRHNGAWRSVCSNSKNWTRSDLEVICRQLGFQGGRWWRWVDRESGISKSRLLLEEPKCVGTESNIGECSNWNTRKMGSGVCDYHPDIGIECTPRHENLKKFTGHWRGIYFSNALYNHEITHQNTLYMKKSLSKLYNVQISRGGCGRNHRVESSIHVEGVPPLMNSFNIQHGAYNAVNVTNPGSPFAWKNCTISHNRGYGIYVNSSVGLVLLEGCLIEKNGADGIKYIHHDTNQMEDPTATLDFCTFPTTNSQTYPIYVSFEQNIYSERKHCHKYFLTRNDQVLTFQLQHMKIYGKGKANFQIYDGINPSFRLLASFEIHNETRPQSITTTGNGLFVEFNAESNAEIYGAIKLTSSFHKWYDLNVTDCVVADNNGRGIAVEDIRSQAYIKKTTVSNNNYVAGVHVLRGAALINITDSKISFNSGDGVNISYAGGARNISNSHISSNKGFGVAVWLNDSQISEQGPVYTHFEQETILAYNQVYRNIESGILVGNFCGSSLVNISGNWFNSSLSSCVNVRSCLKDNQKGFLTLQIGHNYFSDNRKLAIHLEPFVNGEATVEYNQFYGHSYGVLLVKNDEDYEWLGRLPARMVVKHNTFSNNNGHFVANLGLSPYSEVHTLLFTWNYVKDNFITEPFKNNKLVPRSRVAAVLVVSSENVHIYRNIINNPESKYEIGSHLEDQSRIINCTFNAFGYKLEEKIWARLFHRKDRYNLAKIEFIPYLLHMSYPGSNTVSPSQTYTAPFYDAATKVIGGEVDGFEKLKGGAEYFVERDINVRPSGTLALDPGITLRFPSGIGMMVAGTLDARGRSPNDIKFVLNEEHVDNYEMNEAENGTIENSIVENQNQLHVRLFGGKTPLEGRLQVRINNVWGTVCNYGWTTENAALVCHQLGYILNTKDWLLDHETIPKGGDNVPILLSNVKCTSQDLSLLECRSEKSNEFENSCSHHDDVSIRCYEPKWAGLRFGVMAKRSDLQFITIENAGLLDYATNRLKPALQIDLNRHSLENIRIHNNIADGLGIIYSDLYSTGGGTNTVKNCEFVSNMGSGISIAQFGLKVSGSLITKNQIAGIRHEPVISNKQQQEIFGWFRPSVETSNQYDLQYSPLFIPSMREDEIYIRDGETKHFITERVISNEFINKAFTIKTKSGYVLGIQLLNPVQNQSTERLLIYDSMKEFTRETQVWDVGTDLVKFPSTSSSFAITIIYQSGSDALGNTVLLITSTPVRHYNRWFINYEMVPTLSITSTRIVENTFGIWTTHYNRYLSDVKEHYLRKSNQTMSLVNCEISYNKLEAILVQTPYWDPITSNLSEITVVVNQTIISDNGRGVRQVSRDLRNSNNLFHWYLHGNLIERNKYGGLEITLPFVWQYNENYTHTFRSENNTWRYNQQFAFILDGHYSQFNVTNNLFKDNTCKEGLISVRGMEKSMNIRGNLMEQNTGTFMIEFKADSQCEIMGELPAVFYQNVLQKNFPPFSHVPSSLIVFDGLQRVRIRSNLLSDNTLSYSLVAGVRTAQLDSKLDVSENWWGTTNASEIKRRIFDFDDWNNHALVEFRPYLMRNDFQSGLSVLWEQPNLANLDQLGGRLMKSLTLYKRDRPYVVRSDLTVMPDATLTIAPGVTIEFSPRVGLLILGVLHAKGTPDEPIIMRNQQRKDRNAQPLPQYLNAGKRSFRLCVLNNCTGDFNWISDQGFLEYWNATTLQWVPICDKKFTEQNARVVCRELGLGTLNAWVTRGRRYEFQPMALSRIWSWPEPFQCQGNEDSMNECPVRLNGQMYGHRYTCSWDSLFIFIHCGGSNLPSPTEHWGGIRFASAQFESNNFQDRIHDSITHETSRREESVLEYVAITGAGMLHYHKSPAILAISKSPEIAFVNVTHSASTGINFISPERDVKLLYNRIEDCLSTGVAIASLTGEGRESLESSFHPVKKVELPYNAFSLLDMCDPVKEIILQEKVILYYKYSNSPITCIKIFHSAYHVKSFGFRFLQFRLSDKSDKITLYDGSIYNISSPIFANISVDSGLERRFFTTNGTTLSVKMVVSGATEYHGFIAEIVTLKIAAIGFNRDVLHNISYTLFQNNWAGAFYYVSGGEVNPRITMEWNQIRDNCVKLYGNFTSCEASVILDLQNTQNLHFRNNLVRNNTGGVLIKADSRGLATSLKGWIHNNLFSDNKHRSTLIIQGKTASPYQEVVLYRNYFAKNYSPYENIIALDQVMSNFTYNYIHNNIGSHILEITGFERVRLPIYQTTSHNGFYWNYATERLSRSTIVAGTAGQHYVDNILFNPENDYEIITVNRTFVDVWKTVIDARHNYWGYNDTYAVAARVRDFADAFELIEVNFQPYQMNNKTLLDGGKCPPGWNLLVDTCYIYIGAPMNYHDAREFCMVTNSSMPYLSRNYLTVYKFLKMQQETYTFYNRVWVQDIDRINKCTVFAYQALEEDNCLHTHPFICEMDPKVTITSIWHRDFVTMSVIGFTMFGLLLLALMAILWYSKSRHRHVERLQRRNSIRQSLNSLRSISSSQTVFNELSLKRKIHSSQNESPTMNTKVSDYKKMSGSVDSMDKSQFNSSVEDESRSYDIYETNHPTSTRIPKVDKFDLSYQNRAYRDNSTFASREDGSLWHSSVDYLNNSSTLPLTSALITTTNSTNTVASKNDYQRENEYQEYYERPKSSATILETNLDYEPGLPPIPPPRSKSEALLETNFDYVLPTTTHILQQQDYPSVRYHSSTFHPVVAKSKSEPLETAM